MTKILKKHMGQIVLSVVMAILGVACGILPYAGVAEMIVKMLQGARDVSLYLSPAGMICLGFLGGVVFHEISTLTSHNLAYRVIEDERKALAGKLESLSMGEVEKRSSGQWAQFMVETLDKMERPIAHVIPEVFANVFIPVVLVILIFTLDWRLGLANLCTLPLGILFTAAMMQGYQEKSQRYQKASQEMNTSIVEYIRGIQVIKAFNRSASSYGKFREAVNNNKNAMLDWYLSVSFAATAAMEVLPSTLLFVLPAALFLFRQGSMGVREVVMGILLSYACYRPLQKAMSHMDTMANVQVVFQEIQSIMALEPLKRGDTRLPVKSFDVAFSQVDFGYTKEKKVIHKLSFAAKEGELTAIVGYSGGGKSTIAKLIAGFWNPDGGTITIGGEDITRMPLSQNQELVTYVSQENYLFPKSIAENLRMAKEDATREEMEEACKKASCHDFIMGLPRGYDTLVGESGSALSGGERQRITIARALLKNSPIVLLDEATAYSDPDNEAEIQKSIHALVKEKTVIMIAHRLSTIVHAQKILVLQEGKVRNQGTHQELLEKSAVYQELWRAHTLASEGKAGTLE